MQSNDLFLAMKKPLTMLALNFAFTIHNFNCIVLATCFAFYSRKLYLLFQDQIYYRTLDDPNCKSFLIIKKFRVAIHIAFNILFFSFIELKKFTLLQLAVFASSYLSAVHFLFFHDMSYFIFNLTISALNQQIHKIETHNGLYSVCQFVSLIVLSLFFSYFDFGRLHHKRVCIGGNRNSEKSWRKYGRIQPDSDVSFDKHFAVIRPDGYLWHKLFFYSDSTRCTIVCHHQSDFDIIQPVPDVFICSKVYRTFQRDT